MRRITVSVLSILIGLPAFGGSRLPVVNIGSAGVSARAAFGDVPNNAPTPKPVAMEKTNIAAGNSRTVVARRAAPAKQSANINNARAATRNTSIDSGGQIAALDVLSPRRPSSDLWAKSDAPLRMPLPDEISVVRADFDLPEESLDTPQTYAADTSRVTNRANVEPQKIAAHTPRAANVARTENAQSNLSALDTEIARLVELQRRADASVVAPRENVVANAAASDAINITSPAHASASAGRVTGRPDMDTSDAIANNAPVVHRMVVPMADDDVVVRAVEKNTSPRIAAVRDDMTSLSPSELRKAFRKTYLSENKHLSTYQIDERFDVASDISSSVEGFTARRDLSEGSGVRPLEIKIRFRGDDSALSRDNYNLLTEYAGIVVNNPKRAIQIAIPQQATVNMDDRKLAARRLAIVEQVLRDTGVSESRIMPVLSQRDEEGFVLRIISGDQYETLSRQKRDMFGDTIGKKTYKSMTW